MALSAMARLVRRGAFEHFNTGVAGPRSSARMPSKPGYARGGLGAYGSRTFKGRNPEAGEMKDRDFMNSPVFQNFIKSKLRRSS